MIQYSDLHSDSIEKLIIPQIENSPKIPMDKEISEILISLMLAGNKFSIVEKDKPFLVKVIEKRIDACQTFLISDFRLILFLATISEMPGNAILYLWYIQNWCFKNKIGKIDLDIFCSKIFPDGFLSANQLKIIWNNQKVLNRPIGTYDNLVDYNSCADSIRFLAFQPHNV